MGNTLIQTKRLAALLIIFLALIVPYGTHGQSEEEETPEEETPVLVAEVGSGRATVIGREVSFDISQSTIPEGVELTDILWDFGDGVRTTGQRVSHAYQATGSYTVRLRISTPDTVVEDTTEVRVLNELIILTTDQSVSENEINQYVEQAAAEDILLRIVASQVSGPEATIAEDLTQQLAKASQDIVRAKLIITLNTGTIGTSALSQFAQQLRQAEQNEADRTSLANTGIVIVSDTPLGVLAPAAQTVFDQLQPGYVIVSRREALDLLLQPGNPETIKDTILNSSLEYRLLGPFSGRTVDKITFTNFASFGVSFLVNHGVPINSIVLILMLPLIASILSFARQVVGIKAFGLVTPVMTTLSFLVMGLPYGLTVFAAVLLSGTLIRFVLRRLRLLYLPRMALVLTSVSIAILLLLGVGALINPSAVASFSIFPALILIILAEEFIAVQFNTGAKAAFTVTAWTLILAILGYYIMSWQLLRTFIISYPEIVLLTIPINIMLGRWSGLRFTEYIRFRQLLRYGGSP